MRSTLVAARGELRLDFEEVAALEAFVERARRQRGFVVALDRSLELYEPLTVVLSAQGAASVRLSTVVVQAFGTGDAVTTALLLEEENGQPEAAVDAPGKVEADGSERETEGRGVSPAHRVRQLNVSQRTVLATKAARTERRVLLRDRSPQVLAALLVNPRLEAEEALQIVKSTHATSAVLQRVGSDPRWNGNQEILVQLVRNPRTPTTLALNLVERLRTGDLRVLAKMSSGLREPVRRAALREYLRRSSKR